jgi:hypothetical protein
MVGAAQAYVGFQGKAEIADAGLNDARDRCCRKSRRFGWSLA